MTLHAAKGLEFPVVYLMAVEQGLLPHERSLGKDEDVEEERRLFFVGMTRAMTELNLCHSRMREFRGQTLYAVPSMFLEELPPDVAHEDRSAWKNVGRSAVDEWRGKATGAAAAAGLAAHTPARPAAAPLGSGGPPAKAGEYAAGQVVQHEQYGIGQVLDVSGYGALRKIRVRFASAGDKTFVLDKVRLTPIQRK